MPSYVDPPTAVPDTEATAEAFNILGDDIRVLHADDLAQAFQGVSVGRTTSQSIPNSSTTAVIWSAASVDEGGWWTSGTDVVVPAGAIPPGATQIIVECAFYGLFAANGTGWRTCLVLVNGSQAEGEENGSAISGETTTVRHLVWATVAAGDVITFAVAQTAGVALNLLKAHGKVKRLGPL